MRNLDYLFTNRKEKERNPDIYSLMKKAALGKNSPNANPFRNRTTRKHNMDISNQDYLSGYENPTTQNIGEIQGARQPWLHQLGSAAGRIIPNTVMGAIGNTAAALDFEDYNNSDKEVGNWLTAMMEDGKDAVNESMPIYRKNSGKALDFGDSGWWFENGSSLVESIGAFAITGAAGAAGLSAGLKGLGALARGLTGLSKSAKAKKIAEAITRSPSAAQNANKINTVANAAMLNQAEGLLEATDVYDEIYKSKLEEGLSEDEARTKAAEAASMTIGTNRANILLNLTSANLFLRGTKAARRNIRNPYTKSNLQRGGLEGVQESAEEVINLVASERGKALGSDKSTDIYDIINNLDGAEATEAALLGFFGGMGQTAVTTEGANRIMRTTDPDTGQRMSVRDYNVKEYENFTNQVDELNKVKDSDNVEGFTSAFMSYDRSNKLIDKYQELVKEGKNEEADKIAELLVGNQAINSFQNGTVEHLIKTYEELRDGEQKEGMGKDYKEKADKAIRTIKALEEEYNVATRYNNPSEVYVNRSKRYHYDEWYNNLTADIGKKQASTLNNIERLIKTKKLDISAQEALNISRSSLTNTEETSKDKNSKKIASLVKQIKKLSTYKDLVKSEEALKDTSEQIDKLDEDFDKLTSDNTQRKLKEQRRKEREETKKQIRKDAKELEKKAKKAKEEAKKATKIKEQKDKENKDKADSEIERKTKASLYSRLKAKAVSEKHTIPTKLSEKYGEKEGTVTANADGEVTLDIDGESVTFKEADYAPTKTDNSAPSTETNYSTEGGETPPLSKNSPIIMMMIKGLEGLAPGTSTVGTDSKGKAVPFILQQYPDYVPYERNGKSKKGDEVSFKLNNYAKDNNSAAAIKAYNDRDFSNMDLLIDHLPIEVTFADGTVSTPINEAYKANGTYNIYNTYTRPLRKNIVEALKAGSKLEEVKGSVQNQYGGELQMDPTVDGKAAENSLHELQEFGGDTSKVELFFVDDNTQLRDINGKVVKNKFKGSGKGEIYTKIHRANGQEFFLKLNVRHLNENEAEALYILYRQRIIDGDKKSTPISDLGKEDAKFIKENLAEPIKIIGRGKDTTIKEVTDFLIWDGTTNKKSQVRMEGKALLFGERRIFSKAVELEKNKQEFKDFLMNTKRHHIKYKVKANDPDETQVHVGNRAYVDYLLNTKTLSTNAITGKNEQGEYKPTFQGRTQLYLDHKVKSPHMTSKDETVLLSEEEKNSLKAEKDAAFQGKLLELKKQGQTSAEAIGNAAKVIIPTYKSLEKKYQEIARKRLEGKKPDTSVSTNVEEKVAEIQANKEFIKLDESEEFYVNTRTGKKLQRVTQYIGDGKARPTTGILATSGPLGTKIDILTRDFFAGELKDVSEYDIAEQALVDNFILELEKIQAQFAKRGERVLANDIILYNDEAGIAGTVDLLTYDEDGVFRIYDMKTMRGNQLQDSYRGDTKVKYDSNKYGKSNREKHQEQLSLYRILLNNTHGVKANTLGILPIEIAYEEGNTQVSKLEKLPGIAVRPLDKVKKIKLKDPVKPTKTAEKPEVVRSIPYTPKGKKTQRYTIGGTQIFNQKGKEVFKKDTKDRRKIYANLAVKEGRAKLVEHNNIKYIVNDKGQILKPSGDFSSMKEGSENYDAIMAKFRGETIPEKTSKITRKSEEKSVSLPTEEQENKEKVKKAVIKRATKKGKRLSAKERKAKQDLIAKKKKNCK